MAIGWSLSQMKLDDETRKASRNPKGDKAGTRRASQDRYILEASRPATLPWAAPKTTTVRVTAAEYRKVTKRLKRDGWAIRSRKINGRGWFD